MFTHIQLSTFRPYSLHPAVRCQFCRGWRHKAAGRGVQPPPAQPGSLLKIARRKFFKKFLAETALSRQLAPLVVAERLRADRPARSCRIQGLVCTLILALCVLILAPGRHPNRILAGEFSVEPHTEISELTTYSDINVSSSKLPQDCSKTTPRSPQDLPRPPKSPPVGNLPPSSALMSPRGVVL